MRYIGAKNIFLIRHGERLDKVNLNWAANALRPHDTPLSSMGHKQASHLGKWLYSKIPIRKPAKIFCSPFILLFFPLQPFTKSNPLPIFMCRCYLIES